MKKVVNQAKATVSKAKQQVATAVKQVKQQVKTVVQQPKQQVKTTVQQVKQQVKTTVQQVKQQVKTTVQQTKQQVKNAVKQVKQQAKTLVQQTKQAVKEKIVAPVKKALQPKASTSKAKASTTSNRKINSEAELKALLDEHKQTRVLGSNGEPLTTLADKRRVLSAESTATPDGLFPYLQLGTQMTYSMFVEDYLTLSDPKASIGEQFDAALSLINPAGKAKKGKEALESLDNWEKGIEAAYDAANSSKKVKDAQTTQKELDQLGEYVKKLDKGTGKASKLIDSNNPKDYLNEALKRQNLDKAPNSLKEKWSEDGIDFEVRAHPADPRYDKSGSIYRVARRKHGTKPGSNQGYGWEYLGSDGKWYHTSVLKSGDDAAAKATHIQLE